MILAVVLSDEGITLSFWFAVQDSIGRKYFELDNELLKNSATGQ
jgi:hypothetical protein